MRIATLRISFIAAAALAAGSSGIGKAAHPLEQASGLAARITLPDGSARTVKIEGVGCTVSICSRTAIHASAVHQGLVKNQFDSLAVIKDTTANDALFVLKDGTEQRRLC